MVLNVVGKRQVLRIEDASGSIRPLSKARPAAPSDAAGELPLLGLAEKIFHDSIFYLFFFLKGKFFSVKTALIKTKLNKRKKYKTVETKENIDF